MGGPVNQNPSIRRVLAAGLVVLLPGSALAAHASSGGGSPADPETAPVFGRIDVDNQVQGAAFTTVGSVFPGETNIITVGYGALYQGGPAGGGTVQVYRVGADLHEWSRVEVVRPGDDIIFPNQVTAHDVDGDGDTDLIVPSGYFFDTNPLAVGGAKNRGAITWWENQGLDATGKPRPFVRHDVITEQPWSYHSAVVADLDDDGIDDILTTGEQGRAAPDLTDDSVQMQLFRGLGGGEFAAPIALADVGGSIPVPYDIDGDGDLDIASSQYFDVGSGADATPATFLWLENVGDGVAGLSAADFETHTIATRLTTPAGRGVGPGFQIRAIEDFRGDGEVAWVGTNHTNRCTMSALPAEEVFELVPGADPRQQWEVRTLSHPATPSAVECPAEYTGSTPIYPGDEIRSRIGYGQAAPGVFGYGDLDGDGDTDLAVSGDGDRRLFWIEQQGDGETLLHTLTAPGEEFGQSGGGHVADFDGDGVAEVVFSSFDKNTVAIWQRGTAASPYLAPTRMTAAPATVRAAAGASRQVQVTLTATDAGATRSVQAGFRARRTKALRSLGTLTLTRSAAGVYRGTVRVPVTESGQVELSFAQGSLTEVTGERAARATVALTATTVVTGFTKRTTTRRAKVTLGARVSPGVRRSVKVQQQRCGKRACSWRTVRTVRTGSAGKVAVKVAVPRGASKWRLVVAGDVSGTAATSRTKKVIRR
ncbi:FG-GAP-like repeat-containing protein [Nocardioides dubius]|uniref:VCBS repeat-containing protein n=1 Tax=Nocardioides dubius TaxID=317019 RepID=A0ABN1TZX9_9ACTN